MLLCWVFCVLCAQLTATAPVPKYPPKKMIGFMKSYGYLAEPEGSAAETLYTEEGFREVIRQVQRFGGLNETGEMDQDTLDLMDAPRCGVPDVLRESNRTKRYAIAAPGWKKRRISYYLANWSPNLDHGDTRVRLKEAFSLWSEIAPLKFTASSSPDADVVLSFGRGHHGDNYPFDGPGNTLAHAFFPYQHGHQGGDVHFDSDEQWVHQKTQGKHKQGGIDFLTVATHEIGHSLGLAHSTAQGSIMFPYYKGHTDNLKLGYDDVLAMYDLYVRQAEFEDRPLEEDRPQSGRPDHNGDKDRHNGDNRPRDGPGRRPDDNGNNRPDHNGDRTDHNGDRTDHNGDRDRDENRPRDGPGRPDRYPEDRYPADNPHYPPRDSPIYPDRRDYPKPRPEYPVPTRSPGTERPSSDAGREKPFLPGGTDPGREKPFLPGGTDPGREKPFLPGGTDAGHLPKDKTPNRTPGHPKDWDRDSKDNRTELPDLCHGHLDAAALLRNELFFFKEQYVWRFKDRGLLMNGFPVPFHSFFRGLPKSVKKIDAIYQRPSDHHIVLFSGDQVWIYTGDRFTADSPRSLRSYGFSPLIDSVDAAIVWAKNDKTYFFKGQDYWRYDDQTRTMEEGYPMKIHSRWSGVPDHIDTAFTFRDGQTYFFKDSNYWRFDNIGVKVDVNFPRSVTEDWIGC